MYDVGDMCGVYCYKDVLLNKIVYVGQTVQSFKKRHGQHCSSSVNNLINNKIQKHPERYIMCPILFFNKEKVKHIDLNCLERYYIELLDTYNNGFNLTLGGKNHYHLTDEHKQKIGNANRGRKLSKKHREKISKNHARLSGKNHPMYGKIGKDAGHVKYFLWNSHCCQMDKRKQKELSKRFQLVWNAYRLPIGLFVDFVSVEIIYNLICEILEDFDAN